MLNKIINKIKPEKKKDPKTAQGKQKQANPRMKDFGEGLVSVQDIIAPSAIEVDFDWIRINNHYYRTLFVVNYPRFVSANWLSSLINFDHSLDISMNVYPTEGKEILSNLRRKIAEMEAEISSDIQRGKVVDPSTKAKLEDALNLQEELVKGVEKFFQFGLYITIGAESVKELNQITKELESNLGSLLIIPKHATLQMENGFKTTLPLANDKLNVTRNMDTTSLATTFPFVSSDLSDDKGIMYGLNEHNGSLIVFDRFSMENANSILFAKSGAGKSVDGDEPVLIRYENNIQLTKIGLFVDNLIEKHGAEKIEPEIEGVTQPANLEVYTFNESLQGEWSKVTVAARKKAPKKVYEVTTQSGREITITGDHNLVTLKNGKVTVREGRKAETGDYLPLPRRIKNTTKKLVTINILETLKNSLKIYVYGASNLMEEFKSEFNKDNHPNCRYLYKYAQGRPVPITFFNWCLKHTTKELQKGWKNKLKFGSRLGETTQLPAKLKIDEELAYLLGIITAEGTVQDYMVAITSDNPRVQKKVIQTIKNLGFNYFKPNKNEIRIASYLFAQLIINLGIGQGAKNKKVPGIIFNSPLKVISQFIRAYFDGDGGVERHQVCATSKSKQLINQLAYLLNFFDVHTRLRPKTKYSSNTKTKKKRKYWQIS
jgi:intein/homing endonuclease